MSSQAQDFFKQIVDSTDRISFISKFVDDGAQETDYREFKSGKIEEKEVGKIWSKILSGFANTDGGVVVFGVDAKPFPSEEDPKVNIDRAIVLTPHPHAERLAQVLKDHHLNATQDPVLGVEYLTVPKGDTSTEGFVVCYIPAGSNKPYRAKLQKNEPYYFRVHSNTCLIPHAVLRSMFFPQVRANLICDLIASCIANDGRKAVSFKGILRNDGPATAQDMIVKVYSSRGSISSGSASYSMWDPRTEESSFMLGARIAGFLAKRSLHPQDRADDFNFTWQTDEPVYDEDQLAGFRFVRVKSPTLLLLAVHLHDAPAAYFSLQLTKPINNGDSFTMQLIDYDKWKELTVAMSNEK